MTLRKVTEHGLHGIQYAIACLREAREALRVAGARKSADAVRRAIKSAEGAYRHALRAAMHATSETPA